LLLAMLGVLWLQYFRRSTGISRALFVAGLFVVMLVPELPWQPAFALQRWLGGRHDATASISVAFDPHLPRASVQPDSDATSAEDKESRSKDVVRVLLPLRVSGVPPGFLLHTDRAEVRLTGAEGLTLYRGAAHLDAQNPLHQELEIPARLYERAATQTLRLEADYSLTLLQRRTLALLTPNGRRVLDGLGQCAGRFGSEERAIEVSCRAAGDLPPCVSLAIEAADATRLSLEHFICDENYEPEFLRFSVEPLDKLTATLRFRDASDARTNDAHIAVSVYDPKEHFTRHLAATTFRISDWRVADPK
jgi:hypothetical protein